MHDKELYERLNFVVNNDFKRRTYTEGVKMASWKSRSKWI